MNPREQAALEVALKAMKKIEKEKLDINHFEAHEFIDDECWVALDPDHCTIAIKPTLPELLMELGS